MHGIGGANVTRNTRPWKARLALSLLVCVVLSWPMPLQPAAEASGVITYTYVVAANGMISSDLNGFAAHAAATYADPRGWSLGGSIRFVQVASGGDFTLWLSQASLMSSFSSICDASYSCSVGRNVVINDDRWAGGSPYLAMALDDYRHMVVNHETGHWLGLGHSACPGAGQPAFVMQQQSKGGPFLGDCTPNPWPRPEERQAVASARGVPVVDVPRTVGIQGTPTSNGYWVVRSDGRVYARGDAADLGSMATPPSFPVVGLAATPSAHGYWLVGADGGIFTFGDAPFYGSTGNLRLNQPIVGMAATPTGHGYWFVAADGGLFSFGDARFFGSMGGNRLNQPIVGMASTPSGNGYWLVASDGGIFAFGDAAFYGSTGSLRLNRPIVGMTGTPRGDGYWFVASDGGVFSFGSATYFGSLVGSGATPPISAMAATTDGGGYWLLGDDGEVFSFGNGRAYGNAS